MVGISHFNGEMPGGLVKTTHVSQTPPFLSKKGVRSGSGSVLRGFCFWNLEHSDPMREKILVGGSKSYAVGSWGLSNVFVCV